MTKSPPVIITQTYRIVANNSLDSSDDFFKARVKTYFATLPMKVTSGQWVWLKKVYVVDQVRDGLKGRHAFHASYSPEEYVMTKLRGE